ncbi:YggT family protein [Marispirochaeta sp.]|uniref:YggT family protein n=1 Tax=Marispirochaeta sp. TaxID=2038653 RepID=UPI0029C6E0AF|nr:YggT family protein [Marispirochaeta sp.]
MQQVMRFISGALSVYMILIFIRVLMTWFQGASYGRAMEILRSITDPYLYWFRRFPFLRTGAMDFSPLAALIVLVIILNITNRIALTGNISPGNCSRNHCRLPLGRRRLAADLFFHPDPDQICYPSAAYINCISLYSNPGYYYCTDPALYFPAYLPGTECYLPDGLALSGAILLLTRLFGNLIFYHIQRLLASLPF